MTRSNLFAVLLAVLLPSLAAPVVADPVSAAPTEQNGRGPRGGGPPGHDAQHEAERAQREAEHDQREQQREAERALREAQRVWNGRADDRWDDSSSWVQRVVDVSSLGQSVPVTLVIPQAGASAFTPSFTNAVQAGVLPSLLQAVPPDAFAEAPLQLWPVQPNAFAMAHPSLFWAPNDYAGAQQLVSQVGFPGLQPMTLQGPLGYGTYLVLPIR
jgi:hypothetical protein